MMERVSRESLTGKAWIKAYQSSVITSLSQIYPGGGTLKKKSMWDYAVTIMNSHGGYDMRITGYNDYAYSCACIGWVNGEKSLLFFSAGKDHYVTLED